MEWRFLVLTGCAALPLVTGASEPDQTGLNRGAAGFNRTDQRPRQEHGIDRDYIVFGYQQNESQVFHQRWHSLTHVGSRFVEFSASGALTNVSTFRGRSSYLKRGGAADVAGVKVVLVLASFEDGPGGNIEAVMTSPSRRGVLVGQLVSALAADSYSHGVSIDLEFQWGPNVRDGITAFMAELRAGLDTLGAAPDGDPYELSIYTNAIYSSSQWDFDAETGITPSIDYMLYSMYDWATGSTPKAISDFDSCIGSSRMHAYLNDGLPPEKLVPVISAYSRRWSGTATYGGAGQSASSSGFTDALYDVTLNPNIGSPAVNYERGDEAAWYTWNDGVQRVRTFDSVEAFEYKLRHALSLQDPSGRFSGRRLGGVGLWSLAWLSETTSIDPRTGSSASKTRTYPHVYQLIHDIFSPSTSEGSTLETFSGLDFRWRDPNESPDTVGDFDGDSARSIDAAPGGRGRALRVTYDFEGSSGNRAVIAHEMLASPIAPEITDTNAPLAHVPLTTRLTARIFTAQAQPDTTIRMLVVDGAGQLESSPPMSLDRPGWHKLSWSLGNPSTVEPFATLEPALQSGNGVINTSVTDSDIGVYGFSIESEEPVSGSILVDEIRSMPAAPEGRRYRINEFRYADPSQEFVEIYGPAGPLPLGLALRTYRASDGSVDVTIPLSGFIADSGNGFGLFVAGDPLVPGVNQSTSFEDGVDDLANLDPTGLQLIDDQFSFVHDSVVYEAFGGLDDLIRQETKGVTAGGSPWIGEVGTGNGNGGADYTMGRFPDGEHRGSNADDFSFQPASPGQPNGYSVSLPASFDFESTEDGPYQTFDGVRRSSPPAAGLPTSPSGGLAWRCVDTDGGGVIGAVGDASFGGPDPATGVKRGFTVQGHLYVPALSEPSQAVAVGVCGRQGSRFFPPAAEAAESGYESGYWLVYENGTDVDLNDGQPNHGRTWELLHATNDQADGEPTKLLASLPNFLLGVTEGTWTTFSITVDPRAADSLVVVVGTQELFRGKLPKNGPTSGAFQVGFRENHAGPPMAWEGTWVDGLQITRE